MSRIKLLKQPRGQVYLQRVGIFLPPPSPVLASIHVVPCVFFTPERTVTSTDKSVYESIRCTWYTRCGHRSPLLAQCRSIAFTLAQHWNKNGWLSCVCSDCQTGALTLYPRKATTRITQYNVFRPNCEIMLRHLAIIISTKTLWALNHEYNRVFKHEST